MMKEKQVIIDRSNELIIIIIKQTSEFNMKRLKKAEGRIIRNIVTITINTKTIVRIVEMIKFVQLHLETLEK